MKKFITDPQDLCEKLEKIIMESLREEYREIIEMIFFEIDENNYTDINIYFLDKWNEYAYLNDDLKIATLQDNSFKNYVDTLDIHSQMAPLKDAVILNCSGNQLRFIDPALNSYYKNLENHWRMTLVEAVQLLAEREKIGVFEKLVSLNVGNLFSSQHPEIISIYKKQGEKNLVSIEVKKLALTCSVWARFVENGIYFFLTDSKKIELFRSIFKVQNNSCFLDFNRLKFFSFYLENSREHLSYIEQDGSHYKFKVEGSYLDEFGSLENSTGSYLRVACPEKEVIISENMPPVDSKKIFRKWLKNRKELKIDFGWLELEKAEKIHGIIIVDEILSFADKESKYFVALHHASVKLYVKAKEYNKALASWLCLTEEHQNDLWEEYAIILMSLKHDAEFKSFVQSLYDDEKIYDWRKQDLSYIESLWHCRKGDNKRAVEILEKIPVEDRRSYYPWYAACAYAGLKPEYALEQFVLALNACRHNLPVDEDFKNIPPMEELLKKKSAALNCKKTRATAFSVSGESVKPESETINLISSIREMFLSEKPCAYQKKTKCEHLTGLERYLFGYRKKTYSLSTKGVCGQIIHENGGFYIENKIDLDKDISCVEVLEGRLYIAVNNEGLYSVDLETWKIQHHYNRLFSEDVDSMFVDDNYILLCSLLGLEVYRRAGDDWNFVTLLSGGENQIPYSWAKDAVLVGNYIYIAAGNAGLLVYKLDNNSERVHYLTRLSLESETSFVDKIQVLDGMLVLQVENALWTVDIENRRHPVHKYFYQPSQKSHLKLPAIFNGRNHLVFDNEEPVVWEVDFKKNIIKPAPFMDEILENSFISYNLYDAISIDDKKNIVSTGYGIYLIEHIKCSPLVDNFYDEIDRSFDAIILSMVNGLVEFGAECKTKISYIEIKHGYKAFELRIYSDRALVGMQGYEKEALRDYEFMFEDFNISTQVNKLFPYSDMVDKTNKETIKIFIKKLLIELSKTDIFKQISNKKVYLISIHYHEDIDRTTSCVEQIIKY